MDDRNPVLEQEIEGQGVFVGTFTHSLDPKRRLTIPTQWRAQIASPRGLYVLPDVQENCLACFPSGEMARRLGSMRGHSMADSKARHFARVLGSRSDLVAWDAQGRIRVKDDLLDFAGLTDQVLMVGTFDRFELWKPERFQKAGGYDRDDLLEAAQYVGF